MNQFSASIIKNDQICRDFFQLEFCWNRQTISPKPGQFITIRVSDSFIPLLRRPFALSGFNDQTNTASIIFQRKGTGTDLLAAKSPDDKIDVIGPLGNGFPLPQKNQNAILVAGGIGLGPILFLSKYLQSIKTSSQFIFGSKNHLFVPENEEFYSQKPRICTDDGSAGFRGTVSDYLMPILSSVISDSILYCCGPHPMLHACYQLAQKKELPVWVSVEQIMACGIGACMGCVVKVKQPGGYARACKEGPVFSGYDMDWDSG